MSIDWSKIYTLNESNNGKAGKAFENLALEYLQETFSDFDWIPTKASWDNNLDMFHTYQDGYESWAEAKYRKDSDNVGKKDLDPTILSVLIKEKIKLILYITNGTIAPHNLNRITYGARIKNISVSCINRSQLESWLYENPDKYKKYFGDLLPETDHSQEYVNVKDVSFYSVNSIDFGANKLHEKLDLKQEYIMCITLSASKKGHLHIEKNDYPFDFVDSPQWPSANEISYTCGTSAFFLLIRTQKISDKPITLKFCLENGEEIKHIINCEIEDTQEILVVHSSQNQVSFKINKCLKNMTDKGHNTIITIHSKSGNGKTYLLQKLFIDYSYRSEMSLVRFVDADSSTYNYTLLCKMIFFLTFGNLLWMDKDGENDFQEFYARRRELLIKLSCNAIYDTDQLNSLFDGCFDMLIAEKCITELNERIKLKNQLLLDPQSQNSHCILLLDDIQKLNDIQGTFLVNLLKQSNSLKYNVTIILSYNDESKYRNTLEQVTSLTANKFEITDLSWKDIRESLLKNIHIANGTIAESQLSDFPQNAFLLEETLRVMRSNKRNYFDVPEVLKEIKKIKKENLILENKFTGFEDLFAIIDVIYEFEKGMPGAALILKPLSATEADLKRMENACIIKQAGERYIPYHDILRNAYRHLRNELQYNEKMGEYISEIIKSEPPSELIDLNQALAVLVKCGEAYKKIYIDKCIEQRDYYFLRTLFKESSFYAESIYFVSLKEKKDIQYFDEEELYAVFVLADCLKHTGDLVRSTELFQELFDKADNVSTIKYEAGAELVNAQYRALRLTEAVDLTYKLMLSLNNKIQNCKYIYENNLDNRIIRSYYTVTDRYMMILQLQNDYNKAFKLYRESMKTMAKTQPQEDKARLCGELATYIMDFARGLYFVNLPEAKRLMEIAFNFFLQNEKVHCRRISMCKADLLFLNYLGTRNSENSQYDDVSFFEIENDQIAKGYHREVYKTQLKHYACLLLQSEHDGSPQYDSIKEILADIYSQFDDATDARSEYILCSMLAYVEKKKGNINYGQELLSKIEKYVSLLGADYQVTYFHNKRNIEKVDKVAFALDDNLLEDNIYYFDPRIW